MANLKFYLAPAGFFLLVIVFCSQKVGPLPPLGPFFSFYDGIFAQYKKERKIPNFPNVEVRFDEHLIPHIHGKTAKDLYYAQGYITAQMRLWQMDMTTRVAGGELSEVLGSKTQNVDEFFIRLGTRRAAQQSLDLMFQNPKTKEAIESYLEGVNAYIQGLTYKDWPLEYKIVHFKPKLFEPIRIAQLLKLMSFNLSGRSYDLALTQVLQRLGWEKTSELFPDYFEGYDDFFMSPRGQSSNAGILSYPYYVSQIKEFPDFLLPFQNDGSNSWVISTTKSKSKNIILSNDTHLGLKSPPVWFENHLSLDNGFEVYGPSFPGSPGVILGFNKNFAWGATNGTIDALDWYELEFKDDQSAEYLLDGRWVKAEVKDETYVLRGSKQPQVVQTWWTVFGPVIYRKDKLGLAVRWSAHEPSDELSVFLSLDEAQSVKEAVEILKKYKNPIQNFSLVDHEHFAIFTAGLIPKRVQGQGRVVENGRFAKNNWSGFLNEDASPLNQDSKEGFLHSANQRPRMSSLNESLGWDFEEPLRSRRIRDLLEKKNELTPRDSQEMQNESFNNLAHRFFRIVDRERIEKDLHESLKDWDLRDRADSVATTAFYAWFRAIEDELWSKTLSFQTKRFFPKKVRTLLELENLKKQNEDGFYAILVRTQHASNKDLKKWSEVQPTLIRHVTSFPGMDAGEFYPDGSRYSLNANAGVHGGAWRFVIEMSSPPRAWTNIPGSNEGDPLNPQTKMGIAEWLKGQFKEVHLRGGRQ